MTRRSCVLRVSVSLIFMTLGGCSTTAGFIPSLATVKSSAVESFKDPNVWIPVLGAAAINLADADGSISDDAREHTRIFGDPQGSSSDLRDFAALLYGASTLLQNDLSWQGKLRSVGKDALGIGVSQIFTGTLKKSVDRERPDGDNTDGFPSGHSAYLGSYTYATRRNWKQLDMPGWARVSTDVVSYSVAAAGSWARVEAGKHYPSDVLFGYALGHFTSSWVEKMFFSDEAVRLSYVPVQDGGAITLQYNW